MDNSWWFRFVTSKSGIDLSHLFRFPVDDLIGEFDVIGPHLKSERDLALCKSKENGDRTFVGHQLDHQDLLRDSWKAAALFSATGKSDDVVFEGITTNHDISAIRKSYRDIQKHAWTDLSALMPKTKQWFEQTLSPYLNYAYIRISCLDSLAFVPPHIDIAKQAEDLQVKGLPNSYEALNTLIIFVREPAKCRTVHNRTEVPAKDGDIFWFNQSKDHWVMNFDTKSRITIRINCMYKKSFRELIYRNQHLLKSEAQWAEAGHAQAEATL